MATETEGKGGDRHGSKHRGHRDAEDRASKLSKKAYEKELRRLQEELVKMEDWVSGAGARIVVIFEGRDAAGKGGTIKRITQYTNPRVNAPSGISSGTSRTCPRPVRSCCSTAVGTTARASRRSWGSAPRTSTDGSCDRSRSSSGS